MKEFCPKIEVMMCAYCAYSDADMAGSSQLQNSSTVRIVKYLCTGRIPVVHILRAFEAGADAVFVAGCEVDGCHFVEGNLRAAERVAWTKRLLAETGLDGDRLEMFYVASSDPHNFARAVDEMTDRLNRKNIEKSLA